MDNIDECLYHYRKLMGLLEEEQQLIADVFQENLVALYRNAIELEKEELSNEAQKLKYLPLFKE